MILCDAGPLVALINRRDNNHELCAATLPALRAPLITTWPCLDEAMHLLYRYGGYAAQQTLWSYLADDMVTLHIGTETECARMRVLMETYSDAPMDFADASIVAAAESLGVRRVFTLDRHFYFYRIEDAAFEVVPARR